MLEHIKGAAPALLVLAAIVVLWWTVFRPLLNRVVDAILDGPRWVGQVIWYGCAFGEVVLMVALPQFALWILLVSALAWTGAYGYKRREERRRGRRIV